MLVSPWPQMSPPPLAVGQPQQEEGGGLAGHEGLCLACGLASSQSDGGLPLPTGHAGKYLCPDFAGQREGISFLRPPAARPPGINPFTTPWDGGRGLRYHAGTPCAPHWGGELS